MYKPQFEKLHADVLAAIRKTVAEKGENGVIYASDIDTMEIVIIPDENDGNNSYRLQKIINTPEGAVFHIENAYDETTVDAKDVATGILCGIADWLEGNL